MQLPSLGKITMTYLEYVLRATFSQVQCARRPQFKYFLNCTFKKVQTYHSFEVEKEENWIMIDWIGTKLIDIKLLIKQNASED